MNIRHKLKQLMNNPSAAVTVWTIFADGRHQSHIVVIFIRPRRRIRFCQRIFFCGRLRQPRKIRPCQFFGNTCLYRGNIQFLRRFVHNFFSFVRLPDSRQTAFANTVPWFVFNCCSFTVTANTKPIFRTGQSHIQQPLIFLIGTDNFFVFNPVAVLVIIPRRKRIIKQIIPQQAAFFPHIYHSHRIRQNNYRCLQTFGTVNRHNPHRIGLALLQLALYFDLVAGNPLHKPLQTRYMFLLISQRQINKLVQPVFNLQPHTLDKFLTAALLVEHIAV